MKEQNDIDKAIQARLHDAAVPPPAFVWEGVERELRNKRRKRFAFWWSGVGVATLLLVGGILYYQKAETAEVAAAVTENSTPVPAVAPAQMATPPVSTSNTTEAATPSNRTPNDHQATTTAAPRLQTTTPKAATQPRSGTTATWLPIVHNSTKGNQTAAVATNAPVAITAAPNATVTTEATTFKGMALVAPLSGTGLQPLPQQNQPWERTQITCDLIKKSRSLDDRGAAWMVDAHTGVFVAHNALSTNATNPEVLNYLQARKSTEGLGWGFTNGLRASYLFKGHFIVGGGIQYQQYTATFDHKDPYHLVYTTENNGIDTIDATFGIKTTTAYSRFGYLDLPFYMGYEWRSGRFGLQGRAGAAFNVWHWNKGTILDPNSLQPTSFGPSNTDVVPFAATIGWSVHGSAQAFWQFRQKMRLFVEPYYQSPIHSISNETSPIRQRANWMGIRMGATRIF